MEVSRHSRHPKKGKPHRCGNIYEANKHNPIHTNARATMIINVMASICNKN